MSGYYYKNVKISDMIASGSTSDSRFAGLRYATTTDPYRKVDNGFTNVYKVNNAKIYNSVAAAEYNIGDNDTLSVPSWADAFKFHIVSNAGNTGDGGNGRQGQTHFTWQSQRYYWNNGGAGGAGGAGVDIYISNNETLVPSTNIVSTKSGTTRTITIGGKQITINDGAKGGTGNGATPQWNAQAGANGNTGDPGAAGTYSLNGFSVTSTAATTSSTTAATGKVYFYKL